MKIKEEFYSNKTILILLSVMCLLNMTILNNTIEHDRCFINSSIESKFNRNFKPETANSSYIEE